MLADHTFSIIAYKDSVFLEECVKSLLNQTTKSNIIICTSTPSDFIKAIADKYTIKIFINSNQGMGIGVDWNFAYETAKTRYVTLVHQDDIYMPKYLEKVHVKAESIPDNLITFTNYIEIHNGKMVDYRLILFIKRLLLFPFWVLSKWDSPFVKKLILVLGNPVSCPSVMYNKSNLPDFRFVENMKTNLDWEAWLRLSEKKGAFLFVSDKLVAHRIHNESETSNTIANDYRLKEDELMYQKIWGKNIASILIKIYKLSYKSNLEAISKQ